MRVKTASGIGLGAAKAALAAVFFAPFYISFIYSVKTRDEIAFTGLAFPRTIHFENFAQGIAMSNFWLAFRNSVVTTIPTVALTTFICASASYIIARRNDRLYNTVYYLFLMALLIPFQMIMLPLYVNLRNWGLLNTLLGFVLAKTGFSIAYNVLIMTGFVKTVPKEIEEAALIDGAGKWTAFWKVALPLMKPITLTSIILNSLHTWNDFDTAVILLQKTNVRILPLTQYFFFGESSIQLNLAFAVFTLSMIPIIALYLAMQKYVISGIAVGALKG